MDVYSLMFQKAFGIGLIIAVVACIGLIVDDS